MKKFLSIFTLFACMLAIVGCTKDEENKTGTIAGIVSDYANANKPIAGVTVTLNTKGISKTTGSDGRFEFTDVEPGSYTLQAKADNYQATTKQVTVTAGQTANCDFQLEPATRDISIEPKIVTIGGSMNSKEITIINNLNKEISFTLSNLPDFITTDTPNGTISAKGHIDVILKAVNRQSITSRRSGQFNVQVANDSYAVTVTVEPYQTEQMNVVITPTSLFFDKKTDQLTFTMKNHNTYANPYTIGTNLDMLTITPDKGTLPSGATQSITVKVNNRQSITTDTSGQLTLDFSGNTITVLVQIEAFNSTDPEEIPVTKGLLVYYNFNDDNADNALGSSANGNLTGDPKPTFIIDTPSGKGKALSMSLDQQSVEIPISVLKGKNAFSIGMWVKDFGTGPLFSTVGNSLSSPSLYITSDSKLKVYHYSDYYYKEMSTSLGDYQGSSWHHIMVTGSKDKQVVLYIDGRRMDATGISTMEAGGTRMQIGGNAYGYFNAWADPMKIDNVRIHSMMLTDSDVATIYNAEKQ